MSPLADVEHPAEVYPASRRPYLGVGQVEYPVHDRNVAMTYCGRTCLKGRKIKSGCALAGLDVGIKEVNDKIWLTSFRQYDLGYFDVDGRRFGPVDNPFGPEVLPMCPE